MPTPSPLPPPPATTRTMAPCWRVTSSLNSVLRGLVAEGRYRGGVAAACGAVVGRDERPAELEHLAARRGDGALEMRLAALHAAVHLVADVGVEIEADGAVLPQPRAGIGAGGD